MQQAQKILGAECTQSFKIIYIFFFAAEKRFFDTVLISQSKFLLDELLLTR